MAVAPPVVAVEPYAPEVIVEAVVPVAPPVVGYAPPVIPVVPVAPEAEFDYGPPGGPALEVGGYFELNGGLRCRLVAWSHRLTTAR